MGKESFSPITNTSPKERTPTKKEVDLAHRETPSVIEVGETKEKDEELELIQRQLGMKRVPLSETCKSLFSAFAAKLKNALPSGGARRLGQAFIFAGAQLVASGVDAHGHGRHHQEGHHSHHRAVERTHERQVLPHVEGFSEIGMNDLDVAQLIADSLPPLVNENGRVTEVRYERETLRRDLANLNELSPTDSHVWSVTGSYQRRRNGGAITLYAEAFTEENPALWRHETNFSAAMGTFIHELAHSLRPSLHFIRRARGNHVRISRYSERSLTAQGEGSAADFQRVAWEMQSDYMKTIFLNAPEGAEPLRVRAVNCIALEHPESSRQMIEEDIDDLFQRAPGFDWDAGIAHFRKGLRNLYMQFSQGKIQQKMREIPSELVELLSLPDLLSPSHRLTSMEQLTFDPRLQQNEALQSLYQQYRVTQAEQMERGFARLSATISAVPRLRAAWQETAQAVMRFRSYQLKSRVDLVEHHLPLTGSSDQAMRSELPAILESIPVDMLQVTWSRIPEDRRHEILILLRQESNLILHQGYVPPTIAVEAMRVLDAAPLRAL